jgi:hypothetical protein
MTRMLAKSGQSASRGADHRGHSLERGWVLSSSDPARTVDAGGADGAAGVAVAASVSHALCPRVYIDILSILRCRGAGRHRWHWHAVRRTAGVMTAVGRGRVRVRAASINTQCAANRVWVDLRMGGKLRRASGDGRGLLALLLLIHRLVGALLAAKEVEAGATLLRGSGGRGRQLR